MRDLKRYMFNLLNSIESIHKCGVIHRDIKPDNFLYDIETHKCLLIDFGLSECDMDEGFNYFNFKKNNIPSPEDEDLKIILEIQKTMGIKNRIGTRGFLAPEVIFNAKVQGKPVDIWAAGVIFLCFLVKRMPVFNLNKFSKITDETIREIEPLIILFGAEKIRDVAQKHQNLIYIPEALSKLTFKNDIEGIIEKEDVDSDCKDLIRKMLELDCDKRITAKHAKMHRWFNEIRDEMKN